jgi:tripartite-type tricarboxylate transporter receptor subunit TctC
MLLLVGMVVSGWCVSGTYAAEQQFPTRFLEIVVPFAPGWAVDNTIRIIGAEAEKTLGQKITVLNKPASVLPLRLICYFSDEF